MFDISWTEFLLIGVVALIVIGPKELPGVMRTLGQWTRKVRGMAADFQNQFQEAMREAEMTDLKKQVDDMAHDLKNYDPLKDVRSDVEAMGKEFESSLEHKPAPDTAAVTAPVDTAVPADAPQADVASLPPPAAEFPLPDAASELHAKDVVDAATGPVAAEAAQEAAQPKVPSA
jgi:sec-independent protein translocase protein TatB